MSEIIYGIDNPPSNTSTAKEEYKNYCRYEQELCSSATYDGYCKFTACNKWRTNGTQILKPIRYKIK